MVSEASLMQKPIMSTFSHPRQSDYTTICTIVKFLVAARSQTQTKYTMSNSAARYPLWLAERYKSKTKRAENRSRRCTTSCVDKENWLLLEGRILVVTVLVWLFNSKIRKGLSSINGERVLFFILAKVAMVINRRYCNVKLQISLKFYFPKIASEAEHKKVTNQCC